MSDTVVDMRAWRTRGDADLQMRTAEPQQATVPFRDWHEQRLRIEQLERELAHLREDAADHAHLPATIDEAAQGAAILARAVAWCSSDQPAETQRLRSERAFACLPVAVLYAYAFGYAEAQEDIAAPPATPARVPFWTPGRVALVMAVLAILAIVLVGR